MRKLPDRKKILFNFHFSKSNDIRYIFLRQRKNQIIDNQKIKKCSRKSSRRTDVGEECTISTSRLGKDTRGQCIYF